MRFGGKTPFSIFFGDIDIGWAGPKTSKIQFLLAGSIGEGDDQKLNHLSVCSDCILTTASRFPRFYQGGKRPYKRRDSTAQPNRDRAEAGLWARGLGKF